MNPTDPTATHAPQEPAESSKADWDAGIAAAFGLPEKRPHPPQPDPEVGAILAGKYRLTERIGEGGMGSVWVAQQTEPVKRRVAIKLIKAGMDSKSVLARFEAERQALAMMDHPNIAKVLDGGLHDGRPFFVMELVKGVPITDYCDRCKLTPRERLELFLPVCHAIQHAHQKGIIHRDIKPSNVLIALYDDRPVPKVIDFGVAKATGGTLTEQTIETAFGGVIGTPQYMSPEQATLNNLDIDTRSDVYSLGVLLYELLTGSPPFARKDLEQHGLLEMLRVVREVEPPKPSTKLSTAAALPTLAVNRGTEPGKLTKLLRSELDWIVLKALEKDRSRRYETANGFAADINRYLAGEPVVAHPPTLGYRVRKVCDRNRVAIVIAFTFAVTLLTASLISLLQMSRAATAELMAEQRRDEAEAETNRAIKSEADALAAQKRADAAKAEAQAKEAEANAVVKFFEDSVFAAGRPKGQFGGLGHDVSLRDAVRASLPSLATSFKDQPLVEARLRFALGSTFQCLGEPAQAVQQYDQARALYTRHSGLEHRATLRTMNQLASCYTALNRHAEALKLHEQTLAARKRVLPPDDPDTFGSMVNLANSYVTMGRVADGVRLYEDALPVMKAGGSNHPFTLNCMGNLAFAYAALNRHAEALKLYEETLAARKRVLPPDHPDTLMNMNNLANSYAALNRHAEALKLHEEALAAMKRVLPPDHPDTLHSMNSLAASCFALNRHAEAVQLCEEALAARKRVLPPDHPDTLTSMSNLAASYAALNRHAEALKLREGTLAARKRVLPADHPDTLKCMHNLAASYAALNRHAEALKLCEETLAARKRVLPPDHPDTLTSMNDLAWSYARLNRHTEALKLHEETLAAQKRVLPPDHSDTLQSMHNLAMSYAALNRHAEASELYEETLAARKRVLGPDHTDTLWSMHNLANSYTALSRHGEAVKLREEVLGARKRVLPPDHSDTLLSLRKLAECYVTLNRHAEAAPLLDDWLAKADQARANPGWRSLAIALRVQCHHKAGDLTGCRTCADMLEKRHPTDRVSLYNAACCRAMAASLQAKAKDPDAAKLAREDADKAMAWLRKAVAAGWKDAAHMKKDSDLDFLRDREDFKKLLADLEAKEAPKTEVAPPPRGKK